MDDIELNSICSNKKFFSTAKDRVFYKNFGLKLSFFFVILSLILYFCSQTGKNNSQSVLPQSISESKLFVKDEFFKKNREKISYIVKHKDTFRDILSIFTTSQYYIEQYDSSFKSIGLATLFPNDSVVITVDTNDLIVMCSILNNFDCWYHVYLIDSVLYAERRPLNLTIYHCVAKGVVEKTFAEEMYELGIGVSLVTKFMDLFARDINFINESQKNDTFEVIFEKKYCNGNFIGYGSILAAKYIHNKKTYHAIAMKDKMSSINYFDLEGRSIQIQFKKRPVKFKKITSGFSYCRKHPVHGTYRPHFGVDYAADIGTPVYATADGIVKKVGYDEEYGNYIFLAHGAAYQTHYGHLHTINPMIKAGSPVKSGQIIGTLGNSGITTGPHVCYRVKIGSQFIDPLTLAIPTIRRVSEKDRDRFEYLKHEYLYAMGTRFSSNGCFVFDMIQVQSEKEVTLKSTTFIKNHDDYTSNS
jgi:murein DD-endopeptidase MepM/ murein hydrolase activator NlpD